MMNETTNSRNLILKGLFHVLTVAKEILQKESPSDYVELDVVRHMFEDNVDVDTCWESLIALSHKGNRLLFLILSALLEWKEEHQTQPTPMTDQDRKHLRLA